MQYYAIFDEDGEICGFYVDELSGDGIPSEAHPITKEEWETYSYDGGRRYKRDADGVTIRLKTQQELDNELAPKTLEEAQQRKIDELKTARDDQIYTSFTSTALDGVTPKTYHYDQEAAENFRAEATILSLDPTTTSVDWYVVDDAAFVAHTRDQFIQVIKDGGVWEKSAKMKYYNLEAQVKAASDIATVNAIVW